MHNLLQSLGGTIFLFLLVCSFSQCSVEEPDYNIEPLYADATAFDNEIAVRWNSVMNELERYTTGYKSPVAARSMAYINVAAYEAIVQGMTGKYNSIASRPLRLPVPQISKNEAYFWPLVLNSCYKYAIQSFYPTAPSEQQLIIIQTYEGLSLKYSQNISPATAQRSIEFGRQVAETFYTWSKEDQAGDAAYLRISDPSYTPPAGEGLWQATIPDYAPAVLPYWGTVRPFIAEQQDFAIDPPVAYSTDPGSRFYKEAKYTHDQALKIRENPSDEGLWIAQFWSDDFSPLTFTPAGRWTAIASQMITAENVNLADAVMLYAKLSMGLSDAAVGCWQNKFKYNVLRPVDYIRHTMDPDWNTMMKPGLVDEYYSPATPSYPSEHATYGAVATTILAAYFGDQYRLTDRCHEGRIEFRSDPRSFLNLKDMADENAYSRMQIGVCYTFDADAGLRLGHQVAFSVNKIQFKK